MENTLRMKFFSNAFLLKALCNADAIKQLEIIHGKFSAPKNFRLLLGYKSVIEAILYSQLDLLIACPQILRLNLDESLAESWVYNEQKVINDFKFASEDPASRVSMIANHINELLRQTVRSPQWKKLPQALSAVNTFALAVLGILRQCRVDEPKSGLDDGPKLVNKLQAVRLCAAEYLHDYIFVYLYENGDFTWKRAYEYTHPNFLKWESGSMLDEFLPSELETSLDHMGQRPIHRPTDTEHWILGINAALVIATRQMEINEQEYIESSKLFPAKKIFGSLIDRFNPGGDFPSLQYKLTLSEDISERLLQDMSHFVPPASPKDKLTDLLGYRATLVGTDEYADAIRFNALVTGLASIFINDEPIRVLQIEHTQSSDGVMPISLAVFIPCVSPIANYSTWDVFYNVDNVGRWKSPVWQTLKDYEEHINLEIVKGIDTETLLDICDSQAFRYVSEQWKKEKEVNSNLRGDIPELLATLLLAYWNYHPVKVSIEPKVIGELDAVGLRERPHGDECLIIEVKKQSTRQQELQRELTKFSKKVELAKSHPEILANELGYHGSIQNISGLFISLARIGNLSEHDLDDTDMGMILRGGRDPIAEFKNHLESLNDIELWDFDRFTGELDKAGMPNQTIELLQRVTMIWELSDVNLENSIDIDDSSDSGEFDWRGIGR